MSGQVAGVSWSGAGSHEGHTVTAIERWPSRVDADRRLTCGRVRCSCSDEWDVGGWPFEHASTLFAGVDG